MSNLAAISLLSMPSPTSSRTDVSRFVNEGMSTSSSAGAPSAAATAGETHTLAEYDDYMALNHQQFNTDDWYSWDHGLDQHIGLWYSNTDEATCLAMADQIRAALETTGINVGERSEPDAHEMYCGYGA